MLEFCFWLIQMSQEEAGAIEISVRLLKERVATIERVRQRLVEQGLEAALNRKEQQNRRQRLLDGEKEAHLIALTCSSPPDGQGRWTMKMLAERMVALGHVKSISDETVRQTLKKTNDRLG